MVIAESGGIFNRSLTWGGRWAGSQKAGGGINTNANDFSAPKRWNRACSWPQRGWWSMTFGGLRETAAQPILSFESTDTAPSAVAACDGALPTPPPRLARTTLQL